MASVFAVYQYLWCAYEPFAVLLVAGLLCLYLLRSDEARQLGGTANDVRGQLLAEGLMLEGKQDVLEHR